MRTDERRETTIQIKRVIKRIVEERDEHDLLIAQSRNDKERIERLQEALRDARAACGKYQGWLMFLVKQR